MFIKVIATPGARKERITKVKDNEFHIAVREPAERNMANKRIVTLVAEACGVSTTKVRLLTGHHSRSKIVSVDV